VCVTVNSGADRSETGKWGVNLVFPCDCGPTDVRELVAFFIYFHLGHVERVLLKELRNLYSSPNIVIVTDSRTMRWVGHVPHIRELGNTPKA
jgi:hypothetical protein